MSQKGYNNSVSASSNSVASKFKYNGREHEEALGLNLNEMDFRQFDPAIGRFNGIDRLAEFAYGITPYRFAFNNPIIFSDPTGLFETRREARRYRRNNNIKGGKIRKQSDGTFELRGKNGITFEAGDDSGLESSDIFPNDGVINSVTVIHDKSNYKAGKKATADYIAKHNARSQEGSNFLWEIGGVEFVRTDSQLKAIASHLQFTLPNAPALSKIPIASKSASSVSTETIRTVSELSPYALTRTHGLTKSKRAFQSLKASIESAGEVTESIKYVIWNDVKYVVDGHHRLRAAKELGIPNVPVKEVKLPYAGYKTVDDLLYTKY